jgi:hypothetical protein
LLRCSNVSVGGIERNSVNQLTRNLLQVQTIRKNLAIVLVVVAFITIAAKYYVLSGVDGWSLDLVHAIINLVLTVCMISIPIYFVKKADTVKVKAAPSRMLGFAIAFTVFMFYILLFIARLFMMMEYYAGNSTMLTFEFLFMALILVALVYPVFKHGNQQEVEA